MISRRQLGRVGWYLRQRLISTRVPPNTNRLLITAATKTLPGSYPVLQASKTVHKFGNLLPSRQFHASNVAAADLPSHEVLGMPSLSPTMSQGNIAGWKKAEGDAIAAGDVLCEVETDKATIDWESQEDGYLAKILVGDGTKDIPVGTPVAIVVDEKDDIAAFADYTAAGAESTKSAPPPPSSPPKPAPAASPAASFPPHQLLSMPALSPTMSQGNISEWRKAEGDEVSAGDSLAEIETDKATMEWESQDDGFVAKILLPSGSKDIPVGSPAIVLVDSKEDIAAFSSFTADSAAAPPPPSTSSAPPTPSTPPAAPTPSPSSAPQRPARPLGARVIASPYARKLAEQKGVSLEGISGSGPGGRIVAKDVETAEPSAAESFAGAPAFSDVAYDDVNVSQIKKITAKRLLESKQQIPHYYLTIDVKVDNMLKLRGQLNDVLAASGEGKVSVNDFIIKAAALACKKVPEANAAWHGDFIRQYHTVDCSVAVQTPIGLMVPIVKDADTKGLAEIAADVKVLAAKAKEGKLQPHEFTGGTFTISNLGMFGIKQFAAIVNPPQACILAAGTTETRVVLNKSGEPENAQFMSFTLSCDHRVVDGAVGAQWLKAFRQNIEQPTTMLL